MAISVSKALNIESHERGVVYLLLIQSVFLGIFAGALDVGANSLFLQAYGANLMPKAFMISGAVGISFTSLYAFLQKRMPFKLFTVLNLLFAILLTGALRLGYSLYDDPRLAFILLVMMGPVIIISMLGFWGTAGRYFTLRDGKRLFGIIDTGSIVGMILAFYAVPVLIRFNFKVYDTLMIGLASLVAALFFQLIVINRYKLVGASPAIKNKKAKKSGLLTIFKNKYTRTMALFVVLSVITAFFVHYSFMWATEANYPDSRELTGFIGAFFGTMMIFTVVIKSTLYGWLMKNYGLKVTLIISPVLLLILTVVASFVGGFFGYGPESASFTFFFLIIALSKLFNKSLKDAIESPSMKILYQSLDSGERFDVQARIDGIVNELTAFLAGVIMAGLLMLSFINVIHFSYILIVVLFVWVLLGLSLYRSYRKTLNDSLASVKNTVSDSSIEEVSIIPDVNSTPMYSELIRLNPYFYHYTPKEKLDEVLCCSDLRRQMFAWQFVFRTLHFYPKAEIDNLLKRTKDSDLKFLINNYLQRLNLPGKKLDEAFRSYDQNEILAALLQTVEENDTKQVAHIITLLRDRDIQLRAAAIEAAGKLKAKELGSYLVDYLGHPQLYAITWSALVNMGEIILENLENAFYKTGVEIMVQLRIVRAMVAIGGDRANDYLFQKITYHQRDIREAAIDGLFLSDFVPDESSKPILHTCIYEAALAGAMNIAAEYVIREENPGNGLLDAIVQERVKTNRLLFKLLGITYDKSAIEHVQTSIEDTENEDTGFALELLNLIIDDQVFAYLEPYFDDISVVEKIRRLQNEMPVEILPYDKLLVDLINRDSLYSGNYLKICAIETMRLIKLPEAGQYLAAQAFHPNPAVSKSALLALAEKEPDLYQDLELRMKNTALRGRNTPSVSDEYPGDKMISLVEDIKQWKIFSSIDRETIFTFVNHFENKEAVDLSRKDVVSLIKSKTSSDVVLQEGFVINIADYPVLFEQIEYLANEPGISIFQIERDTFIELLFDLPEILEACNNLFSNTSVADYLDVKVK